MSARESIHIQLPVFEGPLDLLLELIERAELDITKVALARVTDQYLSYLNQVKEYRLEDVASFLVIAARLIQIKSEALLPRPIVREPGEEDPGDALARQLVAYKKYKQVAILLSEREQAGLRTFLRLAAAPVIDPRLDLEGLTKADLRQAMLEALENMPKSLDVEAEIASPKVSIRETIKSILTSVRKAGKISFRKLLASAQSRLEIVVSFLALLELVKQKQLEASQDTLFGEIEVSPGAEWGDDQEVDFELEFEG